MRTNIIADVQYRLLESLPTWYPGLSHDAILSTKVQKKRFRWSTHLVFTLRIMGESNLVKNFLVKVIHERETKGRLQSDVRPEQSIKFEYQALSFIYKELEVGPVDGITAERKMA